MNILENVIEISEAQIKRMYENPLPRETLSDRMAFELDLSEFRLQLEAWKRGKPPFMFTLCPSLARSMGFEPMVYPYILFLCPSEAVKLREPTIRNLGIPEYACDHLILFTGAGVTEVLPPLSIMLTTFVECNVMKYGLEVFGNKIGVPFFRIDVPLRYNEENIRYLADQLGEFIEFAKSKVPGAKYDQDKHIELIEQDRIALDYVRKEWQLRKRVPFPMSNAYGLSPRSPLYRLPSNFADSTKALEYWRIHIEELEEQADKVSREEKERQKLRILWVWDPPFCLDFFTLVDLLDSRGVVVPNLFLGHTPYLSGRNLGFGDEMEFGRKLSPLEEMARMMLSWCWREEASTWIDEIIWTCQDLKCEAIIVTQPSDCLTTASMAKLIADKAEKQIDVPTLIIPSTTYDTVMSPDEYISRLNEFIDMALAHKAQASK